MKTDSYFSIGKDHFVCEDYAAHNQEAVIVSDGCSHGSSSNAHKTDFGSRFLTLSALSNLEKYDSLNEDPFVYSVTGSAKTMIKAVGLGTDSLTATLLMLKKKDEIIEAFACGDGVIGAKNRDGSWELYIIEFPSGAPMYLKYLMKEGELQDFIMMYGDKGQYTKLKGDITDPQGYDRSVVQFSIHEQQFFQTDFKINESEFVFVASDGIQSFKQTIKTETSKHKKLVPLRDVVPLLFDFKRYNGSFLRSQMQWQFNKDLEGTIKNKGWMHEDDLGLGVIYCGKD